MVAEKLVPLTQTVAKVHPSKLRLPPLPSGFDLLKLYGKAKGHLSQNFLFNQSKCNRIVNAAKPIKDTYVVEVGPGLGNLTRAIIQKGAANVIAIERDRRFIPALEMLSDASKNTMKFLIQDAKRADYAPMFPKEHAREWNDVCPKMRLIGNLPFNVGTPMLIKWLKQISEHSGPFVHGRIPMVLTFQDELADRLNASVLTHQRSRISVIVQNFCHVQKRGVILGQHFFPRPRVDVAIVKLVPRIEPVINLPFDLVVMVVRTIFCHKNKKILYGIERLFPDDKQEYAKQLIDITQLDPTYTAIMLSVEDFGKICHVYHKFTQQDASIIGYNFQQPKKSLEIPHISIKRKGVETITLEQFKQQQEKEVRVLEQLKPQQEPEVKVLEP